MRPAGGGAAPGTACAHYYHKGSGGGLRPDRVRGGIGPSPTPMQSLWHRWSGASFQREREPPSPQPQPPNVHFGEDPRGAIRARPLVRTRLSAVLDWGGRRVRPRDITHCTAARSHSQKNTLHVVEQEGRALGLGVYLGGPMLLGAYRLASNHIRPLLRPQPKNTSSVSEAP